MGSNRIEKLLIPKFDGEDYPLWKFQIKNLLRTQNLWDVIDESVDVDEKSSSKKEKTDIKNIKSKLDKAFSIICLNLAPPQTRKIIGCVHPVQIFSILKTKYLSKSSTNKVFLLQHLFTTKIDETTLLEDHLNTFNKTISTLEALGDPVPDGYY